MVVRTPELVQVVLADVADRWVPEQVQVVQEVVADMWVPVVQEDSGGVAGKWVLVQALVVLVGVAGMWVQREVQAVVVRIPALVQLAAVVSG